MAGSCRRFAPRDDVARLYKFALVLRPSAERHYTKESMSDELVERCRAVATSTWSDALDQFGVRGVIYGLSVRSGIGRVVGAAVTVKETVGAPESYPVDAFGVGGFIDAVFPGAILVVEMGGAPVRAALGGL